MIWERFFNWQSDMDWTWGPFLFLRPSQNQPILPWVWTRLFLILTLAGLLLIGLSASFFVLLPRFASLHHQALPLTVTETLAAVQAMLHDPATRALLFSLFVGLPPLFFALCLPYHWAWNRRAQRLARQTEQIVQEPEVWPPAIGIHPGD